MVMHRRFMGSLFVAFRLFLFYGHLSHPDAVRRERLRTAGVAFSAGRVLPDLSQFNLGQFNLG
jgi:hypothetical protein